MNTPTEQLMNAFEEFKQRNDAQIKKFDSQREEEINRINAAMDKFEDINKKLTMAEQQAKDAQKLGERLELMLNRMSLGGERDERADRRKLVNDWARGVVNAYTTGVANLPDAQRAALAEVERRYAAMSVSNDTTGGYLAPVEFVAEIIKGVTEISAPRAIVMVRQTSNKSITMPKRTGQFAAKRTVENGTRSETTGLTYGMVEINAPEAYALIDISQQNLEDSAFDMEAEIRMESAEQFAVLEGKEFVSGTGVGEMEGILTNADVGTTNSGSAAAVTADGLLALKHAIKTSYARNATFVMNRTTLGSVRKLKDTTNQYLWMPGIALGKPNTIDGDPYVEVPDMPSEAAGTFPVAYGDFRRAYTMVDRIAMSMLRDPFTQAASGNIRFLFRRRSGGQVVLAEAIRKLKCAV